MGNVIFSNEIMKKSKLNEVIAARSRKQASGEKSRLSLADVAEYTEICFSEEIQDKISQMLSECSGDGVKFKTLNKWIDWLMDNRSDYLEDATALYTWDFYFNKMKLRRYWKFVNEGNFSTGLNIQPKRPSVLVDYFWARKELAAIAIDEAKNDGKVFTMDSEAERMQWRLILRWFLFLDDGLKINSEKWFHLHGMTGVGKSFVTKCLSRLGNTITDAGMCPENEAHFYTWNYANLPDLHEDCKGVKMEGKKPSLAPLNKVEFGNWIFDELCNEPLKIGIYKDEYRFFETILTKRERGKTPRRSIVVSNENEDFIHKRYNEVDQRTEWNGESSRFSSRWRGLFGGNSLVWVGKDKR